MPKPCKNETKKSFVERYMSSKKARRSFPDEKQRYAVAQRTYRTPQRA